mgnify:FL=1
MRISTPILSRFGRSLQPAGRLVLGLLLMGTVLAGCGGSKETTNLNPKPTDTSVENVPDWFLNPPEDPSFLFGAASATSRSMQTAIDKAATSARGDIASTLNTKFEGLTKQFQEEVGTGSDSEMLSQFTEAQKEVVSQVLRGVSTREREIYNEQGVYRAYVLMNMPIGKAASELMSKIQENEEMYTRFRSTQAFEELEEEVEDYERFRDQQRTPEQQ